ncbi:tumor necrosis factor receptor superfamily member 11A [Rhinophrynus dorsalis]
MIVSADKHAEDWTGRIQKRGKALKELFHGNRTTPRECICEDDYHFNNEFDFCKENTKCPPGFGVEHPVHLNKDTVCTVCPLGFYSNSSSSKDSCKPWTNCSEIGLVELFPGSDHSDVVCDRSVSLLTRNRVILLVILTVLFLLIGITLIYIVCCSNNFKELKEGLEQWVNEKVNRFRENEKTSTCKGYCIKNDQYVTVPLKVDCEKSPDISEQRICTPSTACSKVKKENELMRGESVPTEDEYPERNNLDLGENESLITGSEPDSEETSQDSDGSPSFISSQGLLFCPGAPQNECSYNSVHLQQGSSLACGQSTREKLADINDHSNYSSMEPLDSMSGHCPQCMSSFNTSQSAHSTQSGDASNKTGFHFTDTNYQNQSNRSSPGSSPTTDIPPLSGQVTGNHNTTLISNGSVMNIKADVVLLVVSQNTQDAPTTTESHDEGMGSPVQEENQSRCDSFVANTQHPGGKYADILSNANTFTEGWMSATDHTQVPECPITLSQGINNTPLCHNGGFSPVQEEGKPEYFESYK